MGCQHRASNRTSNHGSSPEEAIRRIACGLVRTDLSPLVAEGRGRPESIRASSHSNSGLRAGKKGWTLTSWRAV